MPRRGQYSSLKERARVKVVLTWCFSLWWLSRGMRDWGLLFPGSCRGLWRASGQVKDRA